MMLFFDPISVNPLCPVWSQKNNDVGIFLHDLPSGKSIRWGYFLGMIDYQNQSGDDTTEV